MRTPVTKGKKEKRSRPGTSQILPPGPVSPGGARGQDGRGFHAGLKTEWLMRDSPGEIGIVWVPGEVLKSYG